MRDGRGCDGLCYCLGGDVMNDASCGFKGCAQGYCYCAEMEAAPKSDMPKLGCVNHDCQSSEPVLASAMTLRDYFAAKAMQGALACPNTINVSATTAYKMADAMLQARKA